MSGYRGEKPGAVVRKFISWKEPDITLESVLRAFTAQGSRYNQLPPTVGEKEPRDCCGGCGQGPNGQRVDSCAPGTQCNLDKDLCLRR